MDQSTVPNKKWQKKVAPVIIFWVLFIVVTITYNKAPESRAEITPKQIGLFFVPLFLALYYTFILIFQNRRRGVLASVLICGLLLLRLFSLTNPINVLLLCAFVAFVEWYFSRHSNKFD